VFSNPAGSKRKQTPTLTLFYKPSRKKIPQHLLEKNTHAIMTVPTSQTLIIQAE
jgi:hypothetical protein